MELPPSKKYYAKRWHERGEDVLGRLALCLGLLLSLVILLPFATSTAHNLRTQSAVRSHRFRHHSRAWWHRHRAMLRRLQAMMARRRAMQAAARYSASTTTPMQVSVAQPKSAENHVVVPSAFEFPDNVHRDGVFNMTLPTNWSPSSGNKGAVNFRIAPANGAPEAQ